MLTSDAVEIEFTNGFDATVTGEDPTTTKIFILYVSDVRSISLKLIERDSLRANVIADLDWELVDLCHIDTIQDAGRLWGI